MRNRFHKLIDKKYPWKGRFIRRMTSVIPDKQYVSWQYKRHMGEEINWDNPTNFNEKMQWLKVNWRDTLATKCADKYSVREYIKNTIGEQYLTKLLGVYNNVDEINVNDLPEKFVLKGTHGSGMNVICTDKHSVDWGYKRKTLNGWLKTNYYYGTREWVYKDITPRIICEEYLGDNPVDYKLYCFGGEPKYWFVVTDRSSEVRADYFELNWKKAPFRWIYPPNITTPKRPEKSEEMIDLARKLSKPFPFVRVDFYEIDGKIFFGELTFFHGNGLGKYMPTEYNEILGQMLTLPKID